jgi:uncharacterized protein YeaO (DUF488 family)
VARTTGGFELERIYAVPRTGGYRVLVDRLWPRGVRKDEAKLDEWCRDVAPTTELRRWFAHEQERYPEFVRRYQRELAQPPAIDAVARLLDTARRSRVVLLTANRDLERSSAGVLYRSLVAGTERADGAN